MQSVMNMTKEEIVQELAERHAEERRFQKLVNGEVFDTERVLKMDIEYLRGALSRIRLNSQLKKMEIKE